MLASESPRLSLAGALEVALLRRQGRTDEARERARYWLTIDPTSSLLRYERTLAGDADPDLWLHLGADANRVLDLVDQYLAIGDYEDALGLLDRQYPAVDAPAREVGAVSPQESPLIAYYRAFARAHVGGSTRADYALATTLPTAYVFPSRRSSYAVLAAALEANPRGCDRAIPARLSVPRERVARTGNRGMAAGSSDPSGDPDAGSKSRACAAARGERP